MLCAGAVKKQSRCFNSSLDQLNKLQMQQLSWNRAIDYWNNWNSRKERKFTGVNLSSRRETSEKKIPKAKQRKYSRSFNILSSLFNQKKNSRIFWKALDSGPLFHTSKLHTSITDNSIQTKYIELTTQLRRCIRSNELLIFTKNIPSYFPNSTITPLQASCTSKIKFNISIHLFLLHTEQITSIT